MPDPNNTATSSEQKDNGSGDNKAKSTTEVKVVGHQKVSTTKYEQMTDTGKVSYNLEWKAYQPSFAIIIPSKQAAALFTAEQGKKIMEQAEALDGFLQGLHIAMKTGNTSNIAAAKEAIVTGMQDQDIATSPPVGITDAEEISSFSAELNLVELIDVFKSGRTLFCNAKLVDTCFADAEKAGRLVKLVDVLNPSTLRDKLIKMFQDEWNKVEYSAKGDAKVEGQLKISPKMDEWIKNFNTTCKNFSAEGSLAGFLDYDTKANISLMRYYAGASFSGNFKPSEGKLNLKGNAEAKFDLAKAEASGNIYVPSKDGFHFKLTHTKKENEGAPAYEICPAYPIMKLQEIADDSKWLSDPFRWLDGLSLDESKGMLQIYADKKAKADALENCDIFYDTGSAFIKPDMIANVEAFSKKIALFRWFNQYCVDNKHILGPKDVNGDTVHPRTFKIQMTGFTDTQGGNQYNDRLSEARVKGVYAFITKDVDYWEYLFSKKNEGDRKHDTFFKGDFVIRNILKAVIPAIKKRQTQAGDSRYNSTEYNSKAILPAGIKKHYNYNLPLENGVEYYWENLEVPDKPGRTLVRLDEPLAVLIGWLQVQNGLKRTGRLSRTTRKTLFLEYMQLADHSLTTKDFMDIHILAKGEDVDSLPIRTPDETGEQLNRTVQLDIFRSTSYVQTLDLGLYRLWINAKMSGYVGANIAAAADLDVEVNPNALAFRGIKRQKNAQSLTTQPVTKVNIKSLNKVTPGKWKLGGKLLEGTPSVSRTNSQTAGSQVTITEKKTVNNVQTVMESVYVDKATTSQTASIYRSANGDINFNQKVDYSAEKSRKTTSTSKGSTGLKGVTANLDATGSVFAGAKAGGEFVATIQFKNPEKNPAPESAEKTKNESQGFKTLAGFGGEASGNAGAGLEGELKVGLDDAGNFIITVAAGVTLGLGATVGYTYIVNPENLYDFLCFIYTQLRDADFDYLDFITPKAFGAYADITAYMAAGFSSAKEAILEVTMLANASLANLRVAATDLFTQDETVILANRLVKNISSSNDLIRMAPPRSKGQMIQHILHGIRDRKNTDSDKWSLKGINEDYENAIFEIFSWVQNQKEFKHTVISTCNEGRDAEAGQHQGIYEQQIKLLKQTLDDSEDQRRLKLLEEKLPQYCENKSQSGAVRKNGLF